MTARTIVVADSAKEIIPLILYFLAKMDMGNVSVSKPYDEWLIGFYEKP